MKKKTDNLIGTNLFCCTWNSPLGKLQLNADADHLTGIDFNSEIEQCCLNPVLVRSINWLERYFAGERLSPADLALAPSGTEFQRKVWDILLQIPYGETLTYGQIARKLSFSMSAQAVGNAVGANPIPIIIPCHRVLGADGLGGYSAGTAIKKQLLSIEKIILC